jgi:hypothetical protein
VPPDQTLFTWGNLNEFPLPKLVSIAFCQSEAVAGSYKKNPWNFINCDVKQLPLCVNGVSWPKDPIQVDYTMEDRELKSYKSLTVFITRQNNQCRFKTSRCCQRICRVLFLSSSKL